MTGAGIWVGYGVDDDGPFIEMDERGDRAWARHRMRPLGQVMHLFAHGERFCAGRYDLERGVGSPCPLRRSLSTGRFSQCFDCREATGFNPAFYNAAEVSPQQQKRNAQPHFVYLAHFGGGVLKVGISYARRRLGRLLEQGARMGVIVSHFDDAYAARELEAEVVKLGAAETVRAARKRQLLSQPFRPDPARRDLAAMVGRIRVARPDLPIASDMQHLDGHYGDASMFEGAPADLSGQEPLELHGRCLGLVGDVLMLEGLERQAGQRFMCSLGDLKGRSIELSARSGQNRAEGQLGLFL